LYNSSNIDLGLFTPFEPSLVLDHKSKLSLSTIPDNNRILGGTLTPLNFIFIRESSLSPIAKIAT
jgi:hypothetical protein